jgi:hypothetical protein
MRVGLKVKIVSLVLLVAFLPLAITGIYTTNAYTNLIKSQTLENLKAVSVEVAENYFTFLEESGLLVLRLAEELEKTPTSGWSSTLDAFAKMTDFLVVGVADETGKVVAVSGGDIWNGTWTAPGADISGRDFFTSPMTGKEYPFSESSNERIFYTMPFDDRSISSAERHMIMVFSKKMGGADGKTYVVYAALDWYNRAQNRLLVELDTEFGTEGSVIYLWNSSGNLILADTNAQRVGSFLQASAFGDAWSLYESVSRARPSSTNNLAPQTKEYTLNGQGRLAATCMAPTWFPYSIGFFAYLTNPEKIYGAIDSARNDALLVSAGAASAGVVAVFFVVRSTISKISRVVFRAQKIANGDLREAGK